MHFFRAELAFVIVAALAVFPAYGAKTHHATVKSHAATHASSASAPHSGHAKHSGEAAAEAAKPSSHARHGGVSARHGRAKHGTEAATSTESDTKQTAKTTSGRRHVATPKVARSHGQQAIDPARVTEIQQALIRQHYLTGEASGSWDDTTKAAMTKYQADQGWQTKLIPDSRALKKLGLGPDYSNAINSKKSSFATPPPSSTIPAAQSAGFANAAGVNP